MCLGDNPDQRGKEKRAYLYSFSSPRTFITTRLFHQKLSHFLTFPLSFPPSLPLPYFRNLVLSQRV
jgi:hypothetical protein